MLDTQEQRENKVTSKCSNVYNCHSTCRAP